MRITAITAHRLTDSYNVSISWILNGAESSCGTFGSRKVWEDRSCHYWFDLSSDPAGTSDPSRSGCWYLRQMQTSFVTTLRTFGLYQISRAPWILGLFGNVGCQCQNAIFGIPSDTNWIIIILFGAKYDIDEKLKIHQNIWSWRVEIPECPLFMAHWWHSNT